MPTIERNYKAKDVEMLLTAATITDSAIANKIVLQSKRSTWADPFFDDFKIEIDKAINDFLGADNAKELRNATQVVLTIQKSAMSDLAELKVQIDQDFKSNPAQRTEILNNLGFTAFYSEVKNKDQEALIDLLYQYKTNLTAATLRATIEDKGTAPALLDSIIAHAETLKNANIFQEGKKGTRKELTNEAITVFNAIYNKLMTIAVISAKFFKDQPALKEQFSFNKVKNNLNKKK